VFAARKRIRARLRRLEDEAQKARAERRALVRQLSAFEEAGAGAGAPPVLAYAAEAGSCKGTAVLLDDGGAQVIAVVAGGDPAVMWPRIRAHLQRARAS
jgi:hypothetical protein